MFEKEARKKINLGRDLYVIVGLKYGVGILGKVNGFYVEDLEWFRKNFREL